MSQSPDAEDGSQRSVAELLARYGGSSPSGGGRRRRAPDVDETSAQSVIDGRGSSAGPTASGIEPTVWSVEQAAWSQRTGRRRAPEPAETPAHSTAEPFRPSRSGQYRSSLTSYPSTGSHAGRDPAAAARGRTEDEEATRFGPPPLGNGDLFAARGGDNGSSTEQLPRIEPGPVTSPSPAPVPPRPPARPRGPYRGEPPAGLNASPTAGDSPAVGGSEAQRLRGVPPIEDEYPGAQPEETGASAADDQDSWHTRAPEETSPIREWAVVAGQVGGGVIGGAVLWLVCEWLWQSIPVLALIVALAVITGLVWIVRRLRRADDLQTTVVAVLVGLFVTVSPAALLLVGR